MIFAYPQPRLEVVRCRVQAVHLWKSLVAFSFSRLTFSCWVTMLDSARFGPTFNDVLWLVGCGIQLFVLFGFL